MRVAALYDIHGNLPALEAVLEDVRSAGVDYVVVGGDVVPGPHPGESIAAVRNIGVPTAFIRGNGERGVLAMLAGDENEALPEPVRDALRWVGSRLSGDDVRFLESWPEVTHVDIPEIGDVLFCHATPRNDFEIFTRQTPEDAVRKALAGVEAPLVVCGHTHMQFDRMVADTRVVNAGSVGMPFGEPGAYWLLLGPDVELRRTPFDLDEAAERIRATGYPQAADFAANNVLHPPSERRMLELYGGAELT